MEPLVHALIPLAFLLALYPTLDKRYILFLVPIVWIVDLDTYTTLHRFLFHNLFFIFLLAGVLYIVWDTRAFWVALFYGFSHLVLDFSYPGIGLFYPVVQKTFYLVANVYYSAGWVTNLALGTLTMDEYRAFTQSLGGVARYVGEASALFILLFLILVIVRYRKELNAIIRWKA